MGGYRNIDSRLVLLFGIALLTIIAIVLLVMNYRGSRLEIEKGRISAITNEYEITMGVYADMADSIYHLHLDNPEIKGLFKQGVASLDPAEKDRYRKLLYHKLSGLYQRLGQYDFRQLHFHEKDNRSYLRFHRPEKHGDDLTGIRYSVEYVNREKKYISGFEEGVILNGYRFVYPLSVDEEHIGSVEVSVSMNTVIRQFSQRFNKEAQFIILKSQVMKKVSPSEQPNYASWWVDDRYMLDRSISNECILENRIDGKDAARIKNAFLANSQSGKPFCVELKIDSVPGMLTFLPIKNFLNENVAYVFEIADSKELSDLKMHFYLILLTLIALSVVLVLFLVYYRFSQSTIERMATFDALTSVYTRGVLMQIIDAEHERYTRYRKPFSLIMIDADHFKNINDTYGHHAGDTVLSGITEIMRKSIRKSDSIGRYGGEEFVVVLPETGKQRAVTVAENLRQKISENEFPDIGRVTVSCGVAEVSEQAQSTQDLINEADRKLYTAKQEGRNRVVA